MNPYDFVRIEWDRGVERRPARHHDSFFGLSGRVEGTITALTPCFIREPKSAKKHVSIRYDRFITNGSGDAVIPGSSLKGLVRNLVETIGYGCWLLFDGTYRGKQRGEQVYYERKLPDDFHPCSSTDNLCVACRMFGMVQKRGNDHILGRVRFQDAVCSDPVDHEPIYTIILSTPKAYHRPFYLDSHGDLAGRKYYFHHKSPVEDVGGWLPPKGTAQNQYIEPVGAESVFRFATDFDGLSEHELQLLLYALALEDGVCHKLGYGKPAGLGSVKISLTKLEIMDYEKRYTVGFGKGVHTYEGDELGDYLVRQRAACLPRLSSMTLQDLRRIWKCSGRKDLQYPSWQWFQDPENASKGLSETP